MIGLLTDADYARDLTRNLGSGVHQMIDLDMCRLSTAQERSLGDHMQ